MMLLATAQQPRIFKSFERFFVRYGAYSGKNALFLVKPKNIALFHVMAVLDNVGRNITSKVSINAPIRH
jgi:hypothetical protein